MKILFPILLISSLLMVGVQTTTATSSNLSIQSGDTYEFTTGWNLGLNLSDSFWNDISSIASAHNIAINAKQLYSNLNSLPKIFNIKAIVGNIYSEPIPSVQNEYNTTIQMKLVNETNYMDLTPFVSHLSTICSNFTQKYDGPLNNLTNGTNFFGNMTDYLQQTFRSYYDYGSWGSDLNDQMYYNESTIEGNIISFFVPTDFSFKSQINTTAIDNAMNQPVYGSGWNSTTNSSYTINDSTNWVYLQQTIGLLHLMFKINRFLLDIISLI